MTDRKGFTVTKVYFSNDGTKPMIKCKPHHYEWHNYDWVYYRDDTDENWYMDVPRNGAITCSLKLGYHARLMVKMDR